MELQVLSFETQQPVDKLTVADTVFGAPFKESLAHQAVVTYQARARAGTVKTKSRSEVRGGGRKPFRQKGTGRARAGSIRSPIWVGGGKIHAAKPRDFTTIKFPKKMYRGAMRSIWSELMRQDRIKVVDNITIAEPKTKAMLKVLSQFDCQNRTVVITEALDDNLYYSARNLSHVALYDAQSVDPLILVGCHQILITVEALKSIEEKLGE